MVLEHSPQGVARTAEEGEVVHPIMAAHLTERRSEDSFAERWADCSMAQLRGYEYDFGSSIGQWAWAISRRASRAAPDHPKESWYRAGGDCVCPWCHKEYWRHPFSRDRAHLDWNGEPFMKKLCNGDVVKL